MTTTRTLVLEDETVTIYDVFVDGILVGQDAVMKEPVLPPQQQ